MLIEEMSIDERVAKGAAWLDERCSDWINRIDLEILDISRPALCVLGQSFGLNPSNWHIFMNMHDMGQYDECCLGFESRHALSGDEAVEYEYLNEAWIEYIENRRNN